jgi:spindle assembly abnormal protein 6
MELKRAEPLFNETLTFLIEDSKDTPTDLVFRVLHGSQPSTIPGSSEALYYFEVSDDRDPFFLYYLIISDHDYPLYKSEQAINVDFHVFPTKIIELLRLCMLRSAKFSGSSEMKSVHSNSSTNSNDMSENPNSFGSSDITYLAKLNLKGGLLTFVYSNHFKQTKLIELPLKLGDDRAIKMYLASTRKLLNDQNIHLKLDLEQVRELLKDEQNARKKLENDYYELRTIREADIQTLKATNSKEISEISIKHSDDLNRLREKHSQFIDDIKRQQENELSELRKIKDQFETKFKG